jgi:hypothetical protein
LDQIQVLEDYCAKKDKIVPEAKQDQFVDECHEGLSIPLALASISGIFFKCFYKTLLIRLQ